MISGESGVISGKMGVISETIFLLILTLVSLFRF